MPHDTRHFQPGILTADLSYFFLAMQDDTLACGLTATLPDHLKCELLESRQKKHEEAIMRSLEYSRRAAAHYVVVESSDSEDMDEYDGYHGLEDVYGPLPGCPVCL